VAHADRHEHRRVADLPDLLEPGDLLVVNDTRVIPARVLLRRSTGGAVEMLLLAHRVERRWSALLRPSRRLRDGEELTLADAPDVTVTTVSRDDAGEWVVEIGGDEPVLDLLARHGAVPLPPYITATLADPDRYQTVYARRPASVAAPNA
jgi:S-adenosylmethionine:tRNA ribosyltransferase-isomerase